MSRLLQSLMGQTTHVRKAVPSATPSHNSTEDHANMHLGIQLNRTCPVVPSSPGVFPKAENHVEPSSEVAMFATTHAVGILDLGASQM